MGQHLHFLGPKSENINNNKKKKKKNCPLFMLQQSFISFF